MIFGEYPCCGHALALALTGKPAVSKEVCPGCGAVVWHVLERVDPRSYTDADFRVAFDVDEEAKSIKRKA